MKKYLLTLALLLAMMISFGACGSKDASTDTDTENPVKNQMEVEVPEDSNDTNEPDNTEEPVKPNATEEPDVEMVDWETWATQADNDEVCMVVWNETTGTQKILKPMTENSSIYTVEEGDRFSVPRRNNVEYIYRNSKTKIYWESDEQQYMELEILPGEKTQISIVSNNKVKAISYLFNY